MEFLGSEYAESLHRERLNTMQYYISGEVERQSHVLGVNPVAKDTDIREDVRFDSFEDSSRTSPSMLATQLGTAKIS